MTLLIFIAVALLALALIFGVIRGNSARVNSVDDLERRLRAVDLEAFQNLTNPQDTEYLRTSLSTRDFRRVQRERTFAALKYLSLVSANASVLLRMGELARRSRNVRARQAGQELIDTALHTRMLVFVIYLQMVSDLLRPHTALAKAARLLEGYEELKDRLVYLVSIEQPIMTSRTAAMM